MTNRWYNVAVVLLWLGSMSWLIAEKVLPPLLLGAPPNYRTIVRAQSREPPVGWQLAVNGHDIGWALSETKTLPEDICEIHGRMHLERFPMAEIKTGFGTAILELIRRPLENLRLDAESTVHIDGMGQLLSIDSALRIPPITRLVRLQGTAEGSQLTLSVNTEGFSYRTELFLPADAVFGDAFSPQTRLPGLRVGQTWKSPCYNPLKPRPAVEMLNAKVEGIEPLLWDGHLVQTLLVEYRSDPGYGSYDDRAPRERLWVALDGALLKQEVRLLDMAMTFTRMSPEDADDLVCRVAEQHKDGR